jgi:hypothetical protein
MNFSSFEDIYMCNLLLAILEVSNGSLACLDEADEVEVIIVVLSDLVL